MRVIVALEASEMRLRNQKTQHYYEYAAILSKDTTGKTYIEFPDLPNCCTSVPAGATYEEIYNSAVDYLASYLIAMEDFDQKIPTPKEYDWNMLSDNRLMFVSVYTPYFRLQSSGKPKYIRKSVSIPTYLKKMGQEAGLNFSGLLAEAIEKELKL